jgi:hypothetical protein
MGTADEGLWPRATEAARARWAAQAVEPYLHMARIIMSRAAAGPAGETPFPRASPRPRAAALRRDRTPSRDALGRPPRPDGLGAHRGARRVSPTHTSPGGRPLKAGPLDRTGGSRWPISSASVWPRGPPILRLAAWPHRPRRSGAQRPRDKGHVRRLLNAAFLKSRPEAEAALAKCFADPKTVLACLGLLARLDGELRS